MKEASDPHDFCYYKGGSGWDKITVDLAFLYNMMRLIWLAKGWRKYPRYFMALRYFTAVFWGGKSSFNFVTHE
jgi:hypothetical protein